MSEMQGISQDQLLEGVQDLPVLLLRNTVLFPQVVVPLAVGRPKSLRLIVEAAESETPIAILTQKDAEIDDPTTGDLYTIGTVARVIKSVKLAEDNYSVVIQGQQRIELQEMLQEEPYFRGRFKVF